MFEKSLEEELEAKRRASVECLGMTFENDEKRREYFLEKLREKLKDPEFRKIEGFPFGENEDILALSDTAVQARFAEELASYLELVPESATPSDWGPVWGELLTFDDPTSRFHAIDSLEGFRPGGPAPMVVFWLRYGPTGLFFRFGCMWGGWPVRSETAAERCVVEIA
jgi:hypothetical protein